MSNTLNDLKDAIGFKDKPIKEPKEKDDCIRTSFIPDNDIIYEQCQKYQYINNKGEWFTEVFKDGFKHKPRVEIGRAHV